VPTKPCGPPVPIGGLTRCSIVSIRPRSETSRRPRVGGVSKIDARPKTNSLSVFPSGPARFSERKYPPGQTINGHRYPFAVETTRISLNRSVQAVYVTVFGRHVRACVQGRNYSAPTYQSVVRFGGYFANNVLRTKNSGKLASTTLVTVRVCVCHTQLLNRVFRCRAFGTIRSVGNRRDRRTELRTQLTTHGRVLR